MLTVLAFVVGMGSLIAFHEFGHFAVARLCGVRVLRFSIGFGRPIYRWQRDPSATEFVLCLLPLGGYVRMLDERDGAVGPDDLSRTFNRKPLA
ncbi:MAG: site-2 protease family protein, partial [Burkholderiaceae bacterium]|nr:site-2 protease family protein [Burkholderiaceae bacterium]